MTLVDALSELEEFEDGEKPWCDLVFDLVAFEVRSIDEGTWLLTGEGRALAKGSEIGFGFEIPTSGWKERKLEDADISIHFGKAALLSIGEPTDRLVALYEDWFESPHVGRPSRVRNDCSAVLLGGELLTERPFGARMKLFFDQSADDNLHAELFFAVDTEEKRLRLSEKDPEYRAPLLHWLRQATN